MMTNDLKSLVPAQEKLEWVTPKISLMGAGDTEGSQKTRNRAQERTKTFRSGPS